MDILLVLNAYPATPKLKNTSVIRTYTSIMRTNTSVMRTNTSVMRTYTSIMRTHLVLDWEEYKQYYPLKINGVKIYGGLECSLED